MTARSGAGGICMSEDGIVLRREMAKQQDTQGGSHGMNRGAVREIKEKIADLKGRWPAHSVPPSLWQELEVLEEELEEAKRAVEEGGVE
jgi:hypothetical protein